MFTTGQKVTCIDADNQPTLQEGKEYTVWDVEGERGIRVETESGRIRYSFNNDRFEAAPVVIVEPAMPEATRAAILQAEHGVSHPIARRDGILVVHGIAYKVFITASEIPGVWEIADVEELTF